MWSEQKEHEEKIREVYKRNIYEEKMHLWHNELPNTRDVMRALLKQRFTVVTHGMEGSAHGGVPIDKNVESSSQDKVIPPTTVEILESRKLAENCDSFFTTCANSKSLRTDLQSSKANDVLKEMLQGTNIKTPDFLPPLWIPKEEVPWDVPEDGIYTISRGFVPGPLQYDVSQENRTHMDTRKSGAFYREDAEYAKTLERVLDSFNCEGLATWAFISRQKPHTQEEFEALETHYQDSVTKVIDDCVKLFGDDLTTLIEKASGVSAEKLIQLAKGGVDIFDSLLARSEKSVTRNFDNSLRNYVLDLGDLNVGYDEIRSKFRFLESSEDIRQLREIYTRIDARDPGKRLSLIEEDIAFLNISPGTTQKDVAGLVRSNRNYLHITLFNIMLDHCAVGNYGSANTYALLIKDVLDPSIKEDESLVRGLPEFKDYLRSYGINRHPSEYLRRCRSMGLTLTTYHPQALTTSSLSITEREKKLSQFTNDVKLLGSGLSKSKKETLKAAKEQGVQFNRTDLNKIEGLHKFMSQLTALPDKRSYETEKEVGTLLEKTHPVHYLIK